MNRLLMTTFAAVGLALFAGNQAQAGGPSGNGSGHQSGGSSHQGMNGRQGERGHNFRANERFDFGRHGYRSLSWSRYGWSDRYHRYLYWEPNRGWCFYEPTYSYYLPVAYYREVYPEATLTTAPEVRPFPMVNSAPQVIQRTTVVLGAPTAPAVDLPAPPPILPVAPAPRVIQETKVAGGAP